MLDAATAWFEAHPMLLGALGTLSIALLATTVLATPWLVGRLPPDYFRAEHRPRTARGPRRLVLLALRNLAGLVFGVLGIVMMITPGPGIVFLVLGLTLCEFPGRQTLVRRIATQPAVFDSLNRLRRRRGQAPFEPPVRPR